MKSRPAVVVALAVLLPLLLLAASPALGDPRWWTDDAPVAAQRASVVDLDTVMEYQNAVFVAWIEPSGMIEGALWIAASFDKGCTFCDPVRLETVFDPDADVAIAAIGAPIPSPLNFDPYAAQVLLTAGGVATVFTSNMSIFNMGGSARMCDDFVQAAWTSRVLESGSASQPDIAAATGMSHSNSIAHFHAVWRSIAPTDENEIRYARDRKGDGTGWEVVGKISPSVSPATILDSPQVTADLMTPGPGDESGVNVAWAVLDRGEILYLRSVDSGTTFSADGSPAPSPPATINEQSPGFPAGPAVLDTGDGTSPSTGSWHVAFWQQESGMGTQVRLDGQYQSSPTGSFPSWDPDLIVTGSPLSWEIAPALSVLPGGGGGPGGTEAPAFAFWIQPAAGGTEIFCRAGRLDASSRTAIDLDIFPIPPRQAGDPTVSVNTPVTSCAISDATGACDSTRTSGGAARAAADLGNLVWIDTRDGPPTVWHKRLDVEQDTWITPVLAAECTGPGSARVSVSFTPLGSCRWSLGAWDTLLRYRVYYGTDPGGPFVNADLSGTDPGVPDTILIPEDPALPDPVTIPVEGLLPGTLYHVLVIPEDEARNLPYAFFDPTQDLPAPYAGEASIATPPGCDRCLYRAQASSPDFTGLFVTPPPPNDIVFAPPYDQPYGPCPFPQGGADPEPVLAPGAAPYMFWQVNGSDVTALRIVADRGAQTVHILW